MTSTDPEIRVKGDIFFHVILDARTEPGGSWTGAAVGDTIER